MINTEPLEKIISLALASAYIKNEKSVSVLLLAKPESGKTASLRQFSENNGVVWLSDLTYSGLVSMLSDIEAKKIRTLLIPDMLKLYGRKHETAINIITLLNELIEEGVKEVRTYHTNARWNYARCNVICAITSTDFMRNRIMFGNVGFLSRVIPFSWSYSIESVNKIFNSIIEGKNELQFFKLKLRTDKNIILPKSLSDKIRSNIVPFIADRFKVITKEEIYGFRLQKNLQVLAKANAYLRNSNKVTIKDVNELMRLSKWFNYDFNEL